MSNLKKRKLFKDFISRNQVLIVDKSTASRRRLAKTLVNLGGKRNLIHSVSHFSEAKDIISELKPQLVISDYKINGASGFELFNFIRESFPDEDKMSLVLVTANISQSAVARAAEEEVDTFIIKPYTVQVLEKSLVNAVVSKLHPSDYVQKVNDGKVQMDRGQYNEALETFSEAISMHAKPSLALFYHGLCFKQLEDRDEAKDDFNEGLKFNNIHYKCQIGLFDLHMDEKKYFEAYAVVKRISKYFPANPDRINQIVKLAVATQNYKDIEDYYENFLDLEERNETTIKHICAGLFVTAKFFKIENKKDKVIDIFEKISISCQGNTKFLKSIIKSLVELEEFGHAKSHLKRFTGDSLASSDFRISQFLASSDSMQKSQLISEGLEIFHSSDRDIECFKILINAMLSEDFKERASKIVSEAQAFWPNENISLISQAA